MSWWIRREPDPDQHGTFAIVRSTLVVQIGTPMKFIAWLIAVLTGGYMVPWAIAVQRSKSNTGKVLLVNLLLGWTLIGWVWALVMSLGDEPSTV